MLLKWYIINVFVWGMISGLHMFLMVLRFTFLECSHFNTDRYVLIASIGKKISEISAEIISLIAEGTCRKMICFICSTENFHLSS